MCVALVWNLLDCFMAQYKKIEEDVVPLSSAKAFRVPIHRWWKEWKEDEETNMFNPFQLNGQQTCIVERSK